MADRDATGLPPAKHTEAEQALLGALIGDHDVAGPAAKGLKPHDLYHEPHQLVLRAIHRLDKRHETVDLVSVDAELRERKEAVGESVDGNMAYLLFLVDQPVGGWDAKNVATWVDIIRKRAAQRKIADAIGQAAARLTDDPEQCAHVALDLADHLDGARAVLQPTTTQVEPLTAVDVRRICGETRWAWPGWLPIGNLTMIAGSSGQGKSAVALRIGACFMEGWPWPGGLKFTGTRGKCLWIEAEGGHVIQTDRAAAWDIDPRNLMFASDARLGRDALIDADLDNPEHRVTIDTLASRDDVQVIVLDALSSASSRRDENSSSMLEITRWLAALARDRGKPIVVVHHLRKQLQFDSDVVTLDRLRGSSAIGQLARVVWACEHPDPESTDRRLRVIKSNLGPIPEETHGIRWTETSLVFVDPPEKPKQIGQRDLATEWLRDYLREGPKRSRDLFAAAAARGFSERTISRARENIRIACFRRPNDPSWFWALAADLDREVQGDLEE